MDKKTDFYALPYSLKQAVGARLIAKIVKGVSTRRMRQWYDLYTKFLIPFIS